MPAHRTDTLPEADPPRSTGDTRRFVGRVLIVIALVIGALFAWYVREAFLLALGSLVVATLLAVVCHPLERWTGLRRIWSLTIACLAIALLLVGMGWLVGSQVRDQVSELRGTLPQAVQSLEDELGITLAPDRQGDRGSAGASDASADSGSADVGPAESRAGEDGRVASGPGGESLWSRGFSLFDNLVGQVYSIGSVLFSFLAGLILVVAGGVFFAADPDVYRRGLVKIFPKRQHDKVRNLLTVTGRALHLWLLSQLVSMGIVAVLTGLGTWAIGLPAPLALGLFAGIMEFVPIIGPIIAAVPGLLLAFGQGGSTVLLALAVYLGIQQLESNVIMPIVERHMVQIPPALFLFAALAMGLVFGVVGVLLAAPLTVVAFTAVKALWVRDTLGEETSLPGEERG